MISFNDILNVINSSTKDANIYYNKEKNNFFEAKKIESEINDSILFPRFNKNLSKDEIYNIINDWCNKNNIKLKDNYITLDEFSNMVNRKVSTIKKNYKRIPGIEIIDGEYYVLKGTRYPGNINAYKIKTTTDKMYVMLRLTSMYKYVDARMLKIYDNDFNELVNSLLKDKYLIENNSLNKYGLNSYYCPGEIESIFKKKTKNIAIELLFNLGPVQVKLNNNKK